MSPASPYPRPPDKERPGAHHNAGPIKSGVRRRDDLASFLAEYRDKDARDVWASVRPHTRHVVMFSGGVGSWAAAMPQLTAAQRKLRAQIAAHSRWPNTDSETRLAVTKPGRDAAEQRFINQVDPERKLSEAERAKLARNAKAAYFRQLAFNRSRARQAQSAANRETKRANEFGGGAA